jgi:hypothetical protein
VANTSAPQPRGTKRRKRDPASYQDFNIRDVPVELVASFKAKCAQAGQPMRLVLIGLLRRELASHKSVSAALMHLLNSDR